MVQNKLFAFTGLMFSGKDFVADQAGLKKLSMSEPIGEIGEYFTGYNRINGAAIPGLRKLWQQIGQFGWGAVSEQYPITVERCAFVDTVRRHGSDMTKNFSMVDWSEYGYRKDFWMNILLNNLRQRLFTQGTDRGSDYAIVNIRFNHELLPAQDFGFQIFHIECSDHTRQERMAAVGYKQTPSEAADASEQLATVIPGIIDDAHIIWNDHRPMPDSKRYWTVTEFVEYAKNGYNYSRDLNKYRLRSIEGELKCITV